MSRALGIDYGMARVGVSISDPLRIIAKPFKTIDRKKTTDSGVIIRTHLPSWFGVIADGKYHNTRDYKCKILHVYYEESDSPSKCVKKQMSLGVNPKAGIWRNTGGLKEDGTPRRKALNWRERDGANNIYSDVKNGSGMLDMQLIL